MSVPRPISQDHPLRRLFRELVARRDDLRQAQAGLPGRVREIPG